MSIKKLKVINLYGSPGTGKSATRSGLFWLMKVKNMSVEEVNEYAKYLVLSNRQWQLTQDQLYIMAKQHHKLLILENQYEFAVTDSPLLLSSFYGQSGRTEPGFHTMCMEYYHRYENINFFLTRQAIEDQFEQVGRVHTQDQSLAIEHEQKEFLRRNGVSWVDIELNYQSPWDILEHVAGHYPHLVPKSGPEKPKNSTD